MALIGLKASHLSNCADTAASQPNKLVQIRQRAALHRRRAAAWSIRWRSPVRSNGNFVHSFWRLLFKKLVIRIYQSRWVNKSALGQIADRGAEAMRKVVGIDNEPKAIVLNTLPFSEALVLFKKHAK